MNPETQKLLCDLSAKLGTTVEHLWGVLIRQAPISLCTNVFIVALCYAAGVVLINVGFRKDIVGMDDAQLAAWIALRVAGVAVVIVTTIVTICNMKAMAAALFNPEYWVLLQLKIVK
jgi:hypothetical protein